MSWAFETCFKADLRPIYTVQLCRMQHAYDKSTTRIVSCKSNLQLACDCRVRHEECRGLLKHVLKPYDNRSDRQFDIGGNRIRFFHDASSARHKIACDSRKQKSYRVNRPLHGTTLSHAIFLRQVYDMNRFV